MPSQPLQPFGPPTSLLSSMPGMSAGIAIEWVLYIVFAFWALYTIIAVYHWLKYSHASWIAFPAIAVHLVVSVALMGYALSGHAALLALYLP